MSLSNREIESLLQLIRLTKEDEIDCEACLAHVAEFAELELAGKSIPEGLEALAHHLAVCAECREEYEALQQALDTAVDTDFEVGLKTEVENSIETTET